MNRFSIKGQKQLKPINYRKITRTVLRFALVGLIVSSCVTSVAWLGEITTDTYPRYNPQNDYYRYNYNHDYYQSNSSTRETSSRPSVDEYEERDNEY